MSKIQTVWVYADAAERYADLIAGARRFGAVVNAVVPCESCAAELRACGPAAVYNLGLADIPVIAVEKVAPAAAIVVKERRAKAAASVDLTKAKRVIGIGRGIAKQEDIAMIEAFAKAIGAEIGCSRPIAEGEHWMERERYIGVSGTQLKADIYIALGISGQIQHMVGAADCGVILAVNKDKNAPIFKDADAGIVGDLYKIVPELTRALS